MVGQPRRHGRRLGPPLLGRAAAVGEFGLRQGPAYAGMEQTEMSIDLIQDEGIAQVLILYWE